MNEVRRTNDSRQGESEAKPEAELKHGRRGGASGGWRRNVWKHKLVNQGALSGCEREPGRSQSPHSSDEAGNDRGAKEGREVEA
jgi:hypothetical protein